MQQLQINKYYQVQQSFCPYYERVIDVTRYLILNKIIPMTITIVLTIIHWNQLFLKSTIASFSVWKITKR